MARGTVTAHAKTPAPSRRPAIPLKAPRDPGLAGLRRAARAAIVIPLTFAFGELVLHDTQNVIFIVFGGFALLVMSDFGGLRRARAIAYLSATLVGAVLIALGTVVSQNAAPAGAVMLLVGFAISFASVFGGYVAAAQTGLLLAFVISESVPASAAAVPARIAGWALADVLRDAGRRLPLATLRARQAAAIRGESVSRRRQPGGWPSTGRRRWRTARAAGGSAAGGSGGPAALCRHHETPRRSDAPRSRLRPATDRVAGDGRHRGTPV